MKIKYDINQLELDYSIAGQRVRDLTTTLQQTKLQLKEAKTEKKKSYRRLVLARHEQLIAEDKSEALRDRIRRNVVSFCLSEGINLSAAWTYLYERLRTTTGVNPFELGLGSNLSRLEHVQHSGLLPDLFTLLPELSKLKPCQTTA